MSMREISCYEVYNTRLPKVFPNIEEKVKWMAYFKGLIPNPYCVEKVEQHPDKDIWVLHCDNFEGTS